MAIRLARLVWLNFTHTSLDARQVRLRLCSLES